MIIRKINKDYQDMNRKDKESDKDRKIAEPTDNMDYFFSLPLWLSSLLPL